LATLEETRALNRAGLASDYDVLRLDVEYANVSANLQRARNAVIATRRSLLVEMGLAADLPAVLEGALETIDPDSLEANSPANVEVLLLAGAPSVLEDSVFQLLETAMQRRTDLRQLRSAVLLEESRRRVEAAEFFPRLSLFSNYSLLAQEDGRPNFFGENEFQRTSAAAAGIQVEIPIFQGFKRVARMSQRTAAMRQNETRLARAEQDAVNQVRSLFEAVQEALQRARSQRRAVTQAGRGFEIASAEYREGIGSQLQVTDAEEALRQSEFNYAVAIYDYLGARAQLEMAIGLVPEEPGAFPVARNR
jgi:outer membrane protein TolC